MKKLSVALLLFAAATANAQFLPGQVLTAAELNSALAAKVSANNAVFTGTTTIPGAAITGGTISGLSAPIPLASGGTGATTANGALTALGAAATSGTLSQFSSTTSAQLASIISDETGTGQAVFSTSPSLTTPALGVASATSIAAASSVSTPSVQTNLFGWPGAAGTNWQSQYHANWNVLQTQIANNPTEWQIYTGAAQGVAQSQSGTNQLTLQSGTTFSTGWVGLPYLYFNGVRYKVASVISSSQLTVQTPTGGTVTFGATTNGTYYFVATTTTSVVNVSGTAVTYVSGQPFVSIFDSGQVYINGTAYAATYNSPTSITLGTSAGTLTGATLNQYANINNELSTLRLQGLNGANEEDVALTLRPDGAWLQTLYAGAGQYRPIFLSVGENPAGTISPLISLYPNATVGNPGQLSLGGTGTNQAVQINQNSNNVNYLLEQGGATGTGPSIAARGSDSTVGMGFDVQGANNFTFTSHTFGATEFQIFGVGGSSWLAVGSSSSAAPTLSANGAASNISVNIAPKGSGTLQVGGVALLPSLTGTTGSIGGSALAAGACTSGTVAVSGSTTSMAVQATPATYPGDGTFWHGYVSTAGTVTVKVCAAVALTPTASTYNVRVLQ